MDFFYGGDVGFGGFEFCYVEWCGLDVVCL